MYAGWLLMVTLAGLAFGQGQSMRIEDEHKALREKRRPASEEASAQTAQIAGKLGRTAAAKAVPRAGNRIDEHLFARMARDKVPHAGLTGDWEFARRVHLDLTGRIPEPAALLEFAADRGADKRDRLIERLLESEAFIDRWAYWFGDLYRNCQNRIGWPARDRMDAWIRESLRRDKPYTQFVTELLTGDAPETNWETKTPAATYLARWHVLGDTPTADMHEDTADEIIVNAGRHFLGVNFQCVSCHDGRGHLEKMNLHLTGVTRVQFWNMAAFFSRIRVQKIAYQDRFRLTNDGAPYDSKAPSAVRIIRAAGKVEPEFVLTGEKPDPEKDPREEFARILTSHPQFARAAVNYFWKEMFGVGIVDPIDEFDLNRLDPAKPPPKGWTIQPSHPELLEALAKDFAGHNHSLKWLLRTMAQSTAYQLSSAFPGTWKDPYAPYFARKFVRRLSATELHDAIVTATNVSGNYKFHDQNRYARYLTEMPSPEEVNGGYPVAKFFLHSFGASNREQFDAQNVGSIIQAMLMFGGEFVSDRIQAAGRTRVSELLEKAGDDTALVDQLFLWTVNRRPGEAEKLTCLSRLKENRREGAEDIQWALLNKLDFLFNY